MSRFKLLPSKWRDRRWPLVLAAAVVIGVLAAPFAIASNNGKTLFGGDRNPASGEFSAETKIIADNGTYGTRQSNKNEGDGGGAIYGCRSALGKEACLRASNIKAGEAFQFNSTSGTVGGEITVGSGDTNSGAVPFNTNAAGRVANLNADKVDNLDADQIRPQWAVVTAAGGLSRANGATAASNTAAGRYTVTFGSDISSCSYQATLGSGDSTAPPKGMVGASLGGSNTTVAVSTYNDTGADVNAPFHLTVNC